LSVFATPAACGLADGNLTLGAERRSRPAWRAPVEVAACTKAEVYAHYGAWQPCRPALDGTAITINDAANRRSTTTGAGLEIMSGP
jgi:hypothetical protein